MTTILPITPTEDFWSRRANNQRFSFDFAPFGSPTEITANSPEALVAAQFSARRFSRMVEPSGPRMRLQIVVTDRAAPAVADDLPRRLTYSGVGDWIALSAGEWGHAVGNLQLRSAVLFLSETLAARSQLVSRYFIDHYLLNFLFCDWGMLHASCVLDPSGRRMIMMVGANEVGKSTTALRLLRAGYPLMADGMVLMQLRNRRLIVGGYPIGEVKLRDDVLALFPEYGGETVTVREDQKTVVDLRAFHSKRLAESLMIPAAIQLYFVQLGDRPACHVDPLAPGDALELMAANTVYWDYPEQLSHNTAVLNHVMRTAALYRLTLGTDPQEIVATISNLL